jgi:GPH family glycoside/pentoside/hexuronide:cation symporter
MDADISIPLSDRRAHLFLSRGVMIAWGIGTLGPVTVLSATNALLLRYLTDFYGLSAGLAASLIAFAKFYDVFADVAMGVVSDRTRSRWGRRRPYLVIGAALLAASLIGIFGAPAFPGAAARTWYMGAFLVIYATSYSIFNVPYMAMPAEMTRTYHERTALMTWRVYGVALAIMLATFVGPVLLQALGNGVRAYQGMALIFAPIVIAAGLVTFIGTAHAPATSRTRATGNLRQQIASGLSNRPFSVLMLIKFVTLLTLGTQAIFPYFFQRILGVPNGVLGTYFLCQSAMMLATPMLWRVLSERVGKKAAFMTALAVGIPISLSWIFAHSGEPLALIYLRGLITGCSAAGVILMGQSMLPDTMEYDFRRTGLRREGIFAALYTTVEKLSGALGVALVGAILQHYGYVQSLNGAVVQPASALWAIRLIMAWVPAGIAALGMAALAFYHLDERMLRRTVASL